MSKKAVLYFNELGEIVKRVVYDKKDFPPQLVETGLIKFTEDKELIKRENLRGITANISDGKVVEVIAGDPPPEDTPETLALLEALRARVTLGEISTARDLLVSAKDDELSKLLARI